MKIEVKYFGMIAETIGKTEETFDVDFDSQTDLKQWFESKYFDLKSMNYKIAVNQTISNKINPSMARAEVALLPPFAGG